MPKRKSKKAASSTSEGTVRLCANIRSRKHPDTQCPYTATNGEFCARHFKNPLRFQKSEIQRAKQANPETPRTSYSKVEASKVVQRWWRSQVGFLRYKRQGPGTCVPSEAENQTDIYSLDATSNIPILYRWSYVDLKKHIWVFDIRSLSMTRAQDYHEAFLNPYTREPIPESAEHKFQDRCTWLRAKKYCLVHTADMELTPEQLWHQRLLDVILKYDVLGYHICLHWFEELSLRQLCGLYVELWELWTYRLQLTPGVKEQVVPGYRGQETLLFKYSPSELRTRTERVWWQKTVLDLLDRFVSSARLKEHKILGALYGMTAFAIICPHVRQYYPWLVEMEEA